MYEGLINFQKEIDERIQGVGGYRNKTPDEKQAINALALVGEAGEIANKIKKHIWYTPQEKEAQKRDITEELGDVMYHIAQLATELGVPLSDVLLCCLDKTKRKEEKDE